MTVDIENVEDLGARRRGENDLVESRTTDGLGQPLCFDPRLLGF